MATVFLIPDATESSDWTNTGESSAHLCVDDPIGTPDDDSTYISGVRFDDLTRPIIRVGSGGTVYEYPGQANGEFGDVWGGESTIIRQTNPDGGAWTKSDLLDLQFGARIDNNVATEFNVWLSNSDSLSEIGESDPIDYVQIHWRGRTEGFALNQTVRITQLYVAIIYTPPVVPTGLKVENSTTDITDSTDRPGFKAVNRGLLANEMRVKIYNSSTYNNSTIIADSWWLGITGGGTVIQNNESPALRYDPSTWKNSGSAYLENSQIYYWDIAFGNSGTPGSTSIVTTPSFTGDPWTREWIDSDYNFRKKLTFDGSHAETPEGYVIDFTEQTGNRQIIATDAYHNGAIHPVGNMIAYYDGKTHVIYLGQNSSDFGGNFAISLVSYDHNTGLWGDTVKVASAHSSFDVHNFGVLAIDNDGYIHIFYGSHNSAQRYLRSDQPNITGSLPGETSKWIDPSTGLENEVNLISAGATYPQAFVIPETGRLYMMYRGNSNWKYSFVYTDDNGETWSSSHLFVEDTYNYTIGGVSSDYGVKYRVYIQHAIYDEEKQRLHCAISYTHNIAEAGGSTTDAELGIWYMYSDLDETDANTSGWTKGFNIFRWPSGSLAGYTDLDPVDFDKTPTQGDTTYTTYEGRETAIAFGADRNSRIFHTRMITTLTGDPIVQWCEGQKFYTSTDGVTPFYSERYVSSATFSGSLGYVDAIGTSGSWNIVDISDQTNLMLVTRHVCYGMMHDKDGAIHMFMPVDGKTYQHCKPNADLNRGIGVVTRKSELLNYLEVDDTLSFCDGDDSYIDLLPKVGGFFASGSFTSSTTLPADAKVIDVQVQAWVRRIPGASVLNTALFLEDESTQYSATPFLCNWDLETPIDRLEWRGNARVQNTWATNPVTTDAWTNAEAEAIGFGVKHGSTIGTLRVSKIVKRIHYTKAINDELFASEIYEIVSRDDGLTWTATELSRNSSVGVPPFSHKHKLTNNRIEIVWNSGPDIFYYNDDPYYKAKFTGQDFKMYYGDDEIDRVMDYANVQSTTVTFRTQDILPLDSSNSAKDYYIYYGNPNETVDPLGNPHNIYDFYENFEQHPEDFNINSSSEWTIMSGSAIVYSSPPDYQNKIFGGEKSIEFTNVETVIQHVLDTPLENIYVEGGMWVETVLSGLSYFAFVDDEDNTWEVGLGYGNELEEGGVGFDPFYGYVNPGSGSFRSTGELGPVGKTKVYSRFSAHVTPTSQSAWINDEYIVSGSAGSFTASIGTPTKLRLVVSDQTGGNGGPA